MKAHFIDKQYKQSTLIKFPVKIALYKETSLKILKNIFFKTPISTFDRYELYVRYGVLFIFVQFLESCP